MPRTDPAASDDRSLLPDDVDTFEAFARALGALRRDGGLPSYEEIARRIGRGRAEAGRGGPPAKVTVYDCFRPNRQRLDIDLVHDIVLALTDDARRADAWRHLAQTLNGARLGAHVVVTTMSAPSTPVSSVTDPTDGAVTIVTGLPGVGKSTLARTLVRTEFAAGTADIALVIELRGYHAVLAPAEPVEALRALARAVGARGGSSAAPDLLRDGIEKALADRRAVLVFEDARSPADVVPLLPRGVRSIVTSRSTLHGFEELVAARALRQPVARRELAPLPVEEAAAAIAAGLDGRTLPPAALDRLGRASGGIRLAIDLIVRFIRDHPDWTPDDVAERFDVPSAGSPIHPLLDAVYQSLDANDAAALRRLSLFAAPVHVGTLRRASPETASAVPRLRSLHLVDASPHLTLHDAVRAHARERALDEDPLSRRRTFARAFAEASRARLETGGRVDRAQAVELHAAAVLAHEHNADDELVALAVAAGERLEEDGHWAEIVSVLEHADAVAGPQHRGALAELMARSYEKLGRTDDSLASLHRAQRLGDERMPGRLWNIIGNLHRSLGRWAEAQAAYRRAAAVAREAGNRITEGRAVGNEANLARLRGDLAEACQLFDAAWAITAVAGDAGNRTILRSNRTFLAAALGRFANAEAESRALLAEDPPGMSRAYHTVTLATVLLADGRPAEAVAALEHGQRMSDGAEGFDVLPEIRALRAQALQAVGRLDEAERDARAALEAIDGTGFDLPVPDALGSLALVALDRGRTDDAASLATEALAAAERLGDVNEVARAHEILGRAAIAAGDDERARRHLRDSVRILRRMGHERAGRLVSAFPALVS